MTLPSRTAGESVPASQYNQIITNVNSSPGQKLFTSNGVWSVPDGVHSFRVTLSGGGEGATGDYSSPYDGSTVVGGPGRPGIVGCAIFSGIEIGTSFVITIGAGGAGGGFGASSPGAPGGTTSFGSAMSGTGGGPSSAITVGTGGHDLVHKANTIRNSSGGYNFGDGGAGSGANGIQGFVLIEW
jgi:hypothetical protein